MPTSPRQPRFLLCVRNKGCDDLELRKLYRQRAGRRNDRPGYVRVIDESGEDYLYPAAYFVPVNLPSDSQRAVVAAFRRRSAA